MPWCACVDQYLLIQCPKVMQHLIVGPRVGPMNLAIRAPVGISSHNADFKVGHQYHKVLFGYHHCWIWVCRSDCIDGLVQERHNSSALAMELCLSGINPSIWFNMAAQNSENITTIWELTILLMLQQLPQLMHYSANGSWKLTAWGSCLLLLSGLAKFLYNVFSTVYIVWDD